MDVVDVVGAGVGDEVGSAVGSEDVGAVVGSDEGIDDVGLIGGSHPLTVDIEDELRNARKALRALWCPRIAVFEEFCDLGVEGEFC